MHELTNRFLTQLLMHTQVYAVGDCFMDEVQADNLTTFIDKVTESARACSALQCQNSLL